MKYFRLSEEEILWKVSYINLQMYIACVNKNEEKAREPEKETVIEHEGIDEIANYFDFD
jgi:hypothetical protein